MEKTGVGRAAEAMAAIAIASLGGPVSAGAATFGILVKEGVRNWEAGEGARELHQHVTSAVTEWARHELDRHSVELGLELASEVFSKHGVDRAGIARLNFDATEITRAIVIRARESDQYWGTEAHYAVAEHAIKVTVKALVSRTRDQNPVLAGAVDLLHQAREQLERLGGTLSAPASRSEVIRYLRTRLDDWDRSTLDLGGRTQSEVSRRLQTRPTDRPGRRNQDKHEVLDEVSALEGQTGLVVLGGPGSGKTWLIRRYARECAQTALAALRGGAEIADVELPVLTTWDAWARAEESASEALVAASFDARLDHHYMGGRRRYGGPSQKNPGQSPPSSSPH